MGKRTASDRMAECIIELVHEYKQTIEDLDRRITELNIDVKYYKEQMERAAIAHNEANRRIENIADIIAGITEHTEDGDIRLYLSDIQPEGERKLKRLFKLLDIPMTADQIKDGDTIEKD